MRTPTGAVPHPPGRGLLAQAGDLLRQPRADAARSAWSATRPSAPLYADAGRGALRAAGLRSRAAIDPDGETSQDAGYGAHLYDEIVAAGLDRD